MNWVMLQFYIGFIALVGFFYFMEIVRMKSDIGGKKMMLGMVLSPMLGMFFAAFPYIFPVYGKETTPVLFAIVDRIARYHIFTFLFSIFFFGEDIYKDRYFNGADKTLGKIHSFFEMFILEFVFFVIGYTAAFMLEKSGVDLYEITGVDGYSLCTLIAFIVVFWLNGCIFMRREPNKVVRFLFVLSVETLLLAVSLLTREVLMPSACDFLVSMTIMWAIVDLGKLRRYNPNDLNGEERFNVKVNRLFDKKMAFYGVTLCIDSQPAETDDEYIRALSFFEGALRNMGTIVSDTDAFLYRNTNNSITALIPMRNEKKDLAKIVEASTKWHEDPYVKANIRSRILVILCPKDVKIASVFINVLKLFSRRGLNREMEWGKTYFCEEDMMTRYMSFIAIEKALEQLCKDQDFEVFYQPIYSSEEGYCSCVEALARFPKLDRDFFERLKNSYGEDVCRLVMNESEPDPKNPELRVLKASADDFIRMAESKKLIYKVGMIVYRKACKFFVQNKLNENYGIRYIEINLSLRQCEESTLAADFMRIAQETGLPSGFINFEITEGIARTRSAVVSNNLKMLRDAHFSFSMDDFGTGYSNLIGIVDDKYSVIKIDKSILDSCFECEEPDRRAHRDGPQEREQTTKLLKGVIKMIRGQEKKIVFEGVCDKVRKETLDGFGGGYYQGFYFSQPLSGDRYLEYLRTIGGKCATADNSRIEGAEYKNE
ncbi:MAG: EAL domain-containing protein [Lachnospiraceae bacterium]|nr:EAL domain-containing protein [Lachnospiraceae bacterium]